jgi:DNA-binding transcriptional LysR family regulator
LIQLKVENMNLKTLNAFLITSELESFTAASRVLGLTPAAVSKSIGELEQTIGVRLFHRNTRKLTLTEDGNKLVRDISPAIKKLGQVLNQSKSEELEPAGKLKINLPESFGKKFILPLLPEFMHTYPKIELDVHLQDKKIDPINEGFDVSIGNLDDADSGLIARNLCNIQLVTIATPDYLKGRTTPKKPHDLLSHNLIGYRQLSSGRVVNWRYKGDQESLAITPVGNLTLSNIEAVVSSVHAGLGIGCVGLWHVKADLDSGKVVELLKKYRFDPFAVKIYYSSRDQQPKRVRVFIDYLLDVAKTNFFEK